MHAITKRGVDYNPRDIHIVNSHNYYAKNICIYLYCGQICRFNAFVFLLENI